MNKHIAKLSKITILTIGYISCIAMFSVFFNIIRFDKFIIMEPSKLIAGIELTIMAIGMFGMSFILANELKVTKFRWLK